MKLILTVLFLIVAPCLYAQDTPKDPEVLVKARDKYQKEVDRVTAPVLKAYLAQLDALKKDLGGKGDLKAAVAVQEEIDRVTPQSDAEADANPKDWLTGTTWVAAEGRPDTRRFTKGKVRAEAPGGGSWDDTYRIVSKTKAEGATREKYKLLPDGTLLAGSGVFRRR